MLRSRQRVVRLPAGVSPADYYQFRARLVELHGSPIHLIINDNSSTLLSMKREAGGVRFSVHKMFLKAPDDVVVALAQYLSRPTAASQKLLRRFMNENSEDIEESGQGALRNLCSRGRVYDLHRLAEDVNRLFFNGELKVYITWSRAPSFVPYRRHIQFGCYVQKHSLIRIHPALDNENVPEYFVRFVIFHEMLHARMHPHQNADGRRCVHSHAFREIERRYPDYEKCMAWEKAFMSQESRRAKRDTPIDRN